MILQALYDYYQRKQRDPDPGQRLPAFGLEDKELPFIINLAADGRPLGITDTRRLEGKKKVATRYRVPKGTKRAVNIAPNLLWDTAEYVLGVDSRGNPERVAKQHAAFRQRLAELPAAAQADPGLQAIHAFYANNGAAALTSDPAWAEIAENNPNLSFRLHPDTELVCQRPQVSTHLQQQATAPSTLNLRRCLVTGEKGVVQRIHPSIRGVKEAQPTGADIVSFNAPAYESYGKPDRQGDNAPISEAAAFAYSTALNHLLDRNSRQRLQVGDTSTVFWSQTAQPALEDSFAALFMDSPGSDNPDARTAQVRQLLSAIHSGQFAAPSGQDRFYVLGLAPNAARLAVRFWHAAPLADIGQRIEQWFADLALTRGPRDPEYPSLFRLLTACAVQGKADNIPPLLGGDLLRAILNGSPYPAGWLNAAVQRCRAEQNVGYLRAAALKACLNREARRQARQQPASPTAHRLSAQEFSPMLNPDDPRPAYRLGRLFAVLEKIQEEASPGLNATIRERYYGAASSTPVAVFTTLLRLKNHHLAKLSNRGRVINFERQLGQIMDGLTDFPKHLRLPEQAEFALGYYQQRQDFFSKHDSTANNTTDTATNLQGEPA